MVRVTAVRVTAIQAMLALVLATLTGCSLSREVPLWPIVDLDRPVVADSKASSGSREALKLSLFWPLFRLDTTEPEPKHYSFPLYSYNGNSQKGSFASGIVQYGHGSRRYFTVFPLYWWGKDEKESWHHLFPLAGKNRSQNESLTYVLPYFSSEDSSGWVSGLIVPPVLMSRSHDGEDGWLWFLNTFRSWTPQRDYFFSFPFVMRDSKEIADGSEVGTYVFPTAYFKRQYDSDGEVLSSTTSVWPLYKSVATDTETSTDVLRFPTVSFDGIQSRSLLGWGTTASDDQTTERFEFFPFYARQEGTDNVRSETRIPLLGLSWWNNWQQRSRAFATEWRRETSTGWAAWPFFGVSRTPSKGEVAELATHQRGAGGLYRYDHDPGHSWRLALLYPLQEVSESGNDSAHRVWPLYRYSNDGGNRTLVSMAEIIGVRHCGKLDDSPPFFLHPISYQDTRDGDYHFRFLWKLLESRREAENTMWAVQPLIYQRNEPNLERFLLLGGLFGFGRDDDQDWLRLLWLFNFDLD